MKYFVITEKDKLIKKSELKSLLQSKCDQVLIDLDLKGVRIYCENTEVG